MKGVTHYRWNIILLNVMASTFFGQLGQSEIIPHAANQGRRRPEAPTIGISSALSTERLEEKIVLLRKELEATLLAIKNPRALSNEQRDRVLPSYSQSLVGNVEEHIKSRIAPIQEDLERLMVRLQERNDKFDEIGLLIEERNDPNQIVRKIVGLNSIERKELLDTLVHKLRSEMGSTISNFPRSETVSRLKYDYMLITRIEKESGISHSEKGRLLSFGFSLERILELIDLTETLDRRPMGNSYGREQHKIGTLKQIGGKWAQLSEQAELGLWHDQLKARAKFCLDEAKSLELVSTQSVSPVDVLLHRLKYETRNRSHFIETMGDKELIEIEKLLKSKKEDNELQNELKAHLKRRDLFIPKLFTDKTSETFNFIGRPKIELFEGYLKDRAVRILYKAARRKQESDWEFEGNGIQVMLHSIRLEKEEGDPQECSIFISAEKGRAEMKVGTPISIEKLVRGHSITIRFEETATPQDGVAIRSIGSAKLRYDRISDRVTLVDTEIEIHINSPILSNISKKQFSRTVLADREFE